MAYPQKKRSFFDRLSGSADEFDDFDEGDVRPAVRQVITTSSHPQPRELAARPVSPIHAIGEEEPAEGQLPVDVHQTANEIVIRAFVAGVRPDELAISISRDMVVIEGARASRDQISDGDYFTRELFWGSFARTVLLPQEIDVENSSAISKDGLLTIIMPKLDKARQTKLKVRAG
jgi:HSP20 family protein